MISRPKDSKKETVESGKNIPSIYKNLKCKAEQHLLHSFYLEENKKEQQIVLRYPLESHDIVTITETWWSDSYDCNVGIEDYKLFGKHRKGRRGGDVSLSGSWN